MTLSNTLRLPLLALLFLLIPKESFPQAGQLDPTFGQGGIVTSVLNSSSNSRSFAVEIQTDGKIVATGYLNSGPSLDFAVARYNQDGTPDNTFGTNGIVTTTISTRSRAYSIAIQGDGKLVVAGDSFAPNGDDFALARYNADGTLDNTFGTNGIVTTSIGGVDANASSIAIQSDGKIVAAGSYYNASSFYDDIAVARYDPDGSLDNTFGTNGIVTTPVGPKDNFASSVAIQSDGKIVVTGGAANGIGIDRDFATLRYNPDGTLDNTFGTNGVVTTRVEISGNAFSAKIQSDGKIVVVGGSRDSSTHFGAYFDFAMVRYDSNGTLDNTFGANGIVNTDIGTSEDVARSARIQPDGKIIAAGYYWSGSKFDIAVARYNSDGSLDNTFGTNGIATTPIDSSNSRAESVAIQSDGNIVVSGYASIVANYRFALVRYTGDQATGVGEESIGEIPASFVLEQNYPNPFNPSTTIRYSVPTASPVKLTVYNLIGEQVADLVNRNQAAGTYQLNLNAQHFSSGVYFYRIQAGSFVETRKMILMR